jgi:cytochrome P450
VTTTTGLHYDPYDIEINADPYPVYRRLRHEAPLYYNEEYDFFAVSRFDDVHACFVDRHTYSSARGNVLEYIKSDVQIPSGVIVFEDPPQHSIHRGLLTRVFTPGRINALEARVRDLCKQALEPLVGADHFDFVSDLAEPLPAQTIGMLLGVPESDADLARASTATSVRTEPGQPMEISAENLRQDGFYCDYIKWRSKNPSDDLMTELLFAEFDDETGCKRRLTPDEVLVYVTVLAGAGHETTNRLIGWAGKVLADHPDQRRQLVNDRSLIPYAIEELLRFEPPTPHVARYVLREVEIHGYTVPPGSAMLGLSGAANRDERNFDESEHFDIRRKTQQHLTFGSGIHYCLGAALARLDGRVALDEVLNYFPEWELDFDNAVLASRSTVRGWDSLPVFI